MKHPPPPALAFLEGELARLEAAGLRRDATPRLPGGERPSFCSNDYLGFAREGTGAGASRLIQGDHPAHRALEQALAAWLDVEAGLLFTSGYAANVGLLSALAGPGDLVVSDRLNHASIIDGVRLSRADVVVVPHLDLDAIGRALAKPGRTGRAWVAVESYYSMDADGPDLRTLRAMCDAHGAGLIVDEAHAIGVLGPEGRGRCAEAGVVPDALVATLGKSFGSQGAVVLGAGILREWLWNRARSFVFSTGLAPTVAEVALTNLTRMRQDPSLTTNVLARADQLRAGLLRAGGPKPIGFGPIVPLLVGDEARALELARAMQSAGVEVQAVRPPTVPAGTARLRLTATARHTEEDVAFAVAAYTNVLERLGWPRSSP